MHKGELKACDGRMSVVNELIGAVKFIKLFAWEERWIKRAMAAREVEIKWMIKHLFFSPAPRHAHVDSLISSCSPGPPDRLKIVVVKTPRSAVQRLLKRGRVSRASFFVTLTISPVAYCPLLHPSFHSSSGTPQFWDPPTSS
ncbi:hypothetical protein K438DRAFT_192545 [Mycena galopus ATCC 62051]|nr:hypothetical protein K438DRAFT_192545 [Mycena galopus ATCC 62051]